MPLCLATFCDALDLFGVADVLDNSLDESALLVGDFVLREGAPEGGEVLPRRGDGFIPREVLLVEEVVEQRGEVDDDEVDAGMAREGARD